MRTMFWMAVGMAIGAIVYRYYERNEGRLPIVEQFFGGRTDELVDQAREAARSAQRKTEQAVGETTGHIARETVTAVAEEVAEAEQAKQREERGQ